ISFYNFVGLFNVGDIVFAQVTGYLAWPAKLIDTSNKRMARVEFILTEDKHDVPYKRIWLYNDASRKQFITSDQLSYEPFSTAIYVTEQMLNTFPSDEEMRFLLQMRQQRDTLTVEPQFIAQINILRSALNKTHQNYTLALQAFKDLLEMPLSQLLLIRSREAMESIGLLCRFASCKPEHQFNVQLVRQKAKMLMQRFAAFFPRPYRKPNFWLEYCMLAGIYRRHTAAIVNR
ncbi:hypothetical protein KR044_007451, partial [Drosophila immigrans]